jgi:rare lipoprotein A
MAARRWLGLLNFALLLLVGELRPLGAQTTNLFAGTFDELFSNGGKVTPIFTRPDAPAPPTSIDVSPPPNTEHQRAAEAGKQEGPASDLEERLISPAQAASPPAQSRSEALQPPSTPQVVAAVPTQRQAVIPENVQAGRQIGSGRATWYEQRGRTASGEMFDPNRLTAAHPTLPIGTRLRVVNQANSRSAVVRINDRGPSTRKSVLNLSRGSARAIGITGTGLVALHKLD